MLTTTTDLDVIFTTEYRLLLVFERVWKTAMDNQRRAIESLVESLFELNDPGEIEKAIDHAACALGDHWEAQVDKEVITVLSVAASHPESDKNSDIHQR